MKKRGSVVPPHPDILSVTQQTFKMYREPRRKKWGRRLKTHELRKSEKQFFETKTFQDDYTFSLSFGSFEENKY